MSEPLQELCDSLGIRQTVPTIHYDEVRNNPLLFYREYVAMSQPVVIQGIVDDWPALRNWKGRSGCGVDADYLTAAMRVGTEEGTSSDGVITVALTPTGWADAVTTVTVESDTGANGREEEYFCGPAEARMTLPELFQLIQQAHHHPEVHRRCSNRSKVTLSAQRTDDPQGEDGSTIGCCQVSVPVAYAQFQNSSLTAQFQPLLADVTSVVKDFGAMLFGTPAEAENLWIGGNLSVTSMHQDWYENLYAVVAGGKKVFHLVPPWEAFFLQKTDFADATWNVPSSLTSGDTKVTFTLEARYDEVSEESDGPAEASGGSSRAGAHTNTTSRRQPSYTPWIKRDVAEERLVEGAANDVHLLTVELAPGEVLYLPAMWFHRVSHQSDCAVLGAAEYEERRGTASPPVPAVMAVNYWFDMQFGPSFQYQNYVTTMEQQWKLKRNQP
jgi:hypothetical protein